jgi:hypothetical protein
MYYLAFDLYSIYMFFIYSYSSMVVDDVGAAKPPPAP